MALHRPHGLRYAVASHRTGNRPVRKDGIGIHLDVIAGIQLVEAAGALRADAVSVGRISALVGEDFSFSRGISPVRTNPGNNMGADRMAHAVADKCLLPRDIQLDQMAAGLYAQPRAQRLIQDILLVAEAAADIRFFNPDLPPVHSNGLTDDPSHNMRDLGRRNQMEPFSLHLRVADKVFYMTVLDSGSFIPALYLDESGLLNRILIIAPVYTGVPEYIIGVCLMQLRRPVLHGLLRIQHKGILLITDPDQANSLSSSHFIFRNHCCDVISVEAHCVRQDQAVSHILMLRFHGPGVPGRGKIAFFFQVKTGEDPDHTFHFFRFRCIDRKNLAMCNRGMQYFGNVCSFIAEIVGISGPPGYFVVSIHTLNAFSSIHRPFPLSSICNKLFGNPVFIVNTLSNCCLP